MSIAAINWALNVVRGVSATQKCILISLADRANEDNQCYPSQDDIVERTGANRKTVITGLRELEEKGLITRSRRFSKSTVYTLNISTEIGTNKSPDIGTSISTNMRTSNGTEIGHLTINESSNESIAFDEFWNRYPIKKSKVPAKRAFNRLSKKDQQAAIDGLATYPFSNEKKFIPHASTWINQRRWEDEQETETDWVI